MVAQERRLDVNFPHLWLYFIRMSIPTLNIIYNNISPVLDHTYKYMYT